MVQWKSWYRCQWSINMYSVYGLSWIGCFCWVVDSTNHSGNILACYIKSATLVLTFSTISEQAYFLHTQVADTDSKTISDKQVHKSYYKVVLYHPALASQTFNLKKRGTFWYLAMQIIVVITKYTRISLHINNLIIPGYWMACASCMRYGV